MAIRRNPWIGTLASFGWAASDLHRLLIDAVDRELSSLPWHVHVITVISWIVEEHLLMVVGPDLTIAVCWKGELAARLGTDGHFNQEMDQFELRFPPEDPQQLERALAALAELTAKLVASDAAAGR